MKVILVLVVIFLANCVSVHSDSPVIAIPYSSSEIKIDGDLSDWSSFFKYNFSDTLNSFVNTTGMDLKYLFPPQFNFSKILHPKSRNRVVFQACWNSIYFYYAITVFDKHLFAEVKGRIDKPLVHLNDGIEIYIDTKNDSRHKMDINDYQFLINIKNETDVFKGALKEILAGNSAVPKEDAQNILFNSAVKTYGTLNDDKPDSMYIIEMAIPFAAIGVKPKSNMKMKLDVCVNDIDYHSKGIYHVEEVSTAMWPFSWSGYSDFGYPDYWKTVRFTGCPGWFELISEKYQKKWVYIYIITFIISLIVITSLLLKTYKLKRIPTFLELNNDNFPFTKEEPHQNYNQKMLKIAADYLIEKKSETIHSEKLAKQIGISLRNFQRITREELNLTPTNFICVIKLKLASEYLKNKEGNITDAAYNFGFSDPSYFSRIFKKHFGVSPSDFVKNITN